MTFGQRVKTARYQAGLEQRDLAAKLEVSVSAVQSWEQDVRMPRPRALRKLAAALERPISWFLESEAA